MTATTDAHARLALLDIPSRVVQGFRSAPDALQLEGQDADVLAELASYAVRRGFTRRQAAQEIASRHPHPFEGDTNAAGLTCTECGRSEIFSIHTKEK